MAVQTPKKSSALPWPALVPLGHHAGKAAISLQKTVILVGSRHNAHLHLLSRHVSKAHALILNDGGHSYIRDLASREQVYVNGVAEREAWLNEGDLLKIGSFTFKFKTGPAGSGPIDDTPPHNAVLTIEGADAPLAISEKVMLIGRRGTCDVHLLEASVSTAHAVMFHVDDKRFLRDLGSRTGTWVNGAKIHQVELNPGDTIKIGETEMRYELASAHAHAIGPAGEEKNELDELEHLVGTARIDMVSEMKRAEPLSADIEADLRSMFGAGADNNKQQGKDDDLIELELAAEPAEAPPAPVKGPPEIKTPAKAPPAPPKVEVPKEAPRPQPKAAPIEEPIELEPEPIVQAAPEPQLPEADWVEIDLSTDPDVSDIPSAADTRALGMEFDHEAPKPTLSSRVVDGPVEPARQAAEPEEQSDEQVLLGHDLHVTGGESAGRSDEVAPSEPAVSETELDATWPADVIPAEDADAETVAEENEIGRRGWQKTREEPEVQAEAVEEAPLEVEEVAAVEDELIAEKLPVENVKEEEPEVQAESAPHVAEKDQDPHPGPLPEYRAREQEAEIHPSDEVREQEAAAPLAPDASIEEPAAEISSEPVALASEPSVTPAPAAEIEVTHAVVVEEPVSEPTITPAPADEVSVVETPASQPVAESAPVAQTPIAPEAIAPPVVDTKKGRGRKSKAQKATEAKEAEARAAEAKAAEVKPPAPLVEAPVIAPKKRGRKSKKEKEAELRAAAAAVAPAAAIGAAIAAEAPVQPTAQTPAEIPAAPEIAPVVEESIAGPATPVEIAAEPPAEAEVRAAEPLVEEAIAEVPAETEASPSVEDVASHELAASEPEVSEVAELPTELDIAPAVLESEDESSAAASAESQAVEALPEELDVSPAMIEDSAPEVQAGADGEADADLEAIEELPPELDVSPAVMEEEESAVEANLDSSVEANVEDETFAEANPTGDEDEPFSGGASGTGAHAPLEPASADTSEDLDEILALEEEAETAPAAVEPQTAVAVAPSEFSVEKATDNDDFFADIAETMPILELDSAELAPGDTGRDPDVLLALDQVDPEGLDEIEEVIEPTEPTPDSALDLQVSADQETVAPQTGESSLTDSVFGQQIEEFSAASTGDIVEEELPEIEEFRDPDEALADALSEADQAPATSEEAPAAEDEIEEAAVIEEEEPQVESISAIDSELDLIAGGMDTLADGVAEEPLDAQQFDAGGQAVELEPPGDAQAGAVLDGQTFVGGGDAQNVALPVADQAAPAEELESQSFTTTGDTHQAAPPPRPDLPGGPPETTSQTPLHPSPPRAGLAGGFVMGADLSSFIGGMPLNLPDLPSPPQSFGRAQMSFAGAKAPWEQPARPSFPMGQSLAQEMMDAAEGLRDAEAMDDDLPAEEPDAINDEGAPGDEWNMAGLMAEEYESPLEEWIQPAAQSALQPVEESASDVAADEMPAEEEALTETSLEEEQPDAQAQADEEIPQLEELEMLGEEMEEPAESEEFPTLEVPTTPLAEEADAAELDSVESLEASDIQPEEELPELEAIDDLTPEDEQSPQPHDELSAQDQAELESLEVEEPPTLSTEVESEHAEFESDLPVIPEDDASSTISEEDLLRELDAQFPPEILPEETPVSSTTTDHTLEEPAPQASTPPPVEADRISADPIAADPIPATPAPQESIEELHFDDPPPPRLGAIEQAVAELEIEQVPEAESLVDRTPPPPVTPVKPAAKPKMVPPPPARTLRPRRGAPAAQTEAAPADPVFGSLEHGSASAAPFGMAQSREIDVFSQASTDLATAGPANAADAAVFGGQMLAATGAPTNGDSHAPARRQQRAIVPPRMGGIGAGAVAADHEPAEPLNRPSYRVVQRRSNGKRILLVVVLMIALMAAAAFAILHFIHPRQTSSAELHYAGFDSLSKRDLQEVQREQADKLTSQGVLRDASTEVTVRNIELGFLQHPVDELVRELSPQWAEGRPSVMTIDYTGTDPQDKKRLYALLVAMYTQMAPQADKRRALGADIDRMQKEIRAIEAMQAELDAKKKAINQAPTDEAIKALREKFDEADSAYGKTVAKVKDAHLEVQAVEDQLRPAPGSKAPASGDPKPAAADGQLADLQKSLNETTAQIASLKASASQDADAKRKALDAAIETFQQSAAGVMKENPQLAQYVRAVQQLQEETHKLGGDLIERQQQQYTHLSNLKKRLEDQMQARRTETWAADKDLIALRAQLDLAERGYNALMDVQTSADSKDVKKAIEDIKEIKGRIDARKLAIGDDPIFTGVASDLQNVIKINQESLAADRERIEKAIKDQEQAFAQRNIVETLPQTQQAQASALKASQEHVNDLRKQYAAALDLRTAESNAAMRDLEAKASDLAAKVEERKRVITAKGTANLTQQQEANLGVKLEQKQAALKAADQEATDTAKFMVDRSRELELALAKQKDVAHLREECETLSQALAGADEKIKQYNRSIEDANKKVKDLVTIARQPAESDVQIISTTDNSWRYIAYSETGLAVIFVGLIALVSLSGAKQYYEDPSQYELPEAETGPLAIEEIGRRTRTRTSKSAVG